MKMNTRNLSALCCSVTLLFLAGCASSGPRVVSISALGEDAQDTVYTGSDEQFHYFTRTRGWRHQQMKVAKAQLKLSREFPRAKGAKFIEKTPDGKIDVLMMGEQDGAADSQPSPSAANTASSLTGFRR